MSDEALGVQLSLDFLGAASIVTPEGSSGTVFAKEYQLSLPSTMSSVPSILES